MRKDEGDAALPANALQQFVVAGRLYFTKIYSSHRYALRNRIALYETIAFIIRLSEYLPK